MALLNNTKATATMFVAEIADSQGAIAWHGHAYSQKQIISDIIQALNPIMEHSYHPGWDSLTSQEEITVEELQKFLDNSGEGLMVSVETEEHSLTLDTIEVNIEVNTLVSYSSFVIINDGETVMETYINDDEAFRTDLIDELDRNMSDREWSDMLIDLGISQDECVSNIRRITRWIHENTGVRVHVDEGSQQISITA